MPAYTHRSPITPSSPMSQASILRFKGSNVACALPRAPCRMLKLTPTAGLTSNLLKQVTAPRTPWAMHVRNFARGPGQGGSRFSRPQARPVQVAEQVPLRPNPLKLIGLQYFDRLNNSNIRNWSVSNSKECIMKRRFLCGKFLHVTLLQRTMMQEDKFAGEKAHEAISRDIGLQQYMSGVYG